MSLHFNDISPQPLLIEANAQNFDENAYLRANSDVNTAILNNDFKSGLEHFNKFGYREKRNLLFHVDRNLKKLKLDAIRPLLNDSLKFIEHDNYFDFLTDELKNSFNIIDTDAVSSNNYDEEVLSLINSHKEEFILDCGAGSRGVYYPNVVNFEIAVYPSTDVKGVGEMLPFRDNSFSAVISIAVLEHVKDPWLCAKEILRVLRPGGDLICCVPFLQPLHGYPHHYYNMTALGLLNLFKDHVDVVTHKVPPSTHPIWSLSWILNSWLDGLDYDSKQKFLNYAVRDLISSPLSYMEESFVKNLSEIKKFELASATVLHAKKSQ